MSLDVYLMEVRPTEVYNANVTHNLHKMAEAAGIYQAVWRPEELGIKTAKELIPILREGIANMEAEPAKYEALNPSNGWGSYKIFLPWLKQYLAACEEHPDATIEVSR